MPQTSLVQNLDQLKLGKDVKTAAAEIAQEPQENLSLEKEAFLIYTQRARELKDLYKKDLAELHQRREKLKFLHELMQEIKNSLNEKSELDLKSNDPANLKDDSESLKGKLQKAIDMGIKISINNKDKLSAFDVKNILENLNMEATDLHTDNEIQIKKMDNLFKECEQTIMIAKSVLSALDKPKRAAIQGMKG